MAVEPRTKAEAQDRRGRRGGPVALLVLLAACAPTPAQKFQAEVSSVQREQTPATMIERGKAFAAVGDYTRAEEYFASALDLGANARDLLPELMDVCIKTGRYRSAIQHGENHLRRYPNDLQTRVMVGALYAAINDGHRAKVQLEPVVKEGTRDVRPPLLAEAHYLLGVVARDDDSDAVATDRHFREYLRLEPNGAHASEAKASLLTKIVAAPDDGDAGAMPRRLEAPRENDGG